MALFFSLGPAAPFATVLGRDQRHSTTENYDVYMKMQRATLKTASRCSSSPSSWVCGVGVQAMGPLILMIGRHTDSSRTCLALLVGANSLVMRRNPRNVLVPQVAEGRKKTSEASRLVSGTVWDPRPSRCLGSGTGHGRQQGREVCIQESRREGWRMEGCGRG